MARLVGLAAVLLSLLRSAAPCKSSCRTFGSSAGYQSKTKEPPIELVLEFLHQFGLDNGGVLRCDEGGELALSDKFRQAALTHHYVVEPTGPDTAQQNAGVERFNDTLAVVTRALLYGAGLTAEYWSTAIVHAAYIINHRVHQTTKVTPFE